MRLIDIVGILNEKELASQVRAPLVLVGSVNFSLTFLKSLLNVLDFVSVYYMHKYASIIGCVT